MFNIIIQVLDSLAAIINRIINHVKTQQSLIDKRRIQYATVRSHTRRYRCKNIYNRIDGIH